MGVARHFRLVAARLHPTPTIPVRESDEPLRGVKAANIVPDRATGRFTFSALYTHTPYGVEAHAACRGNPSHTRNGRVPELSCSCGFYAYKKGTKFIVDEVTWQMHTSLNPFTAILDVELAGRVIVCQYGYRAEYQRVMAARIAQLRCTQVIPTPGAVGADSLDRGWATYARITVTTTSSALGWGPTLCQQSAVAVRTRDAIRQLSQSDPFAPCPAAFCSDHAKSLDPRCWHELDYDILGRLRDDLPTDWSTL